MPLETFTNSEHPLNIHRLSTEVEAKRSSLPFDAKRDMDAGDFMELERLIEGQRVHLRENTLGAEPLLWYAFDRKILDPSWSFEYSEAELEKIRVGLEQVQEQFVKDSELNIIRSNFDRMAAYWKFLAPEQSYQPSSKSLALLDRNLNEFWRKRAGTDTSGFENLFEHTFYYQLLSGQRYNVDAIDKAAIDRQLYIYRGEFFSSSYASFARLAAHRRLLIPEEPVPVTEAEWNRLRAELDSRQWAPDKFFNYARNLTILAAPEIHCTANSFELRYPESSLAAAETPPLPEVRKF